MGGPATREYVTVVTAPHSEQVNDIVDLSSSRGNRAKPAAITNRAQRASMIRRRRRRAGGLLSKVPGSDGSNGRPHSGQTASGKSRRRYPQPRQQAHSGTLTGMGLHYRPASPDRNTPAAVGCTLPKDGRTDTRTRSLLKKGTGSERGSLSVCGEPLRRRACPLFQQTARQRG